MSNFQLPISNEFLLEIGYLGIRNSAVQQRLDNPEGSYLLKFLDLVKNEVPPWSGGTNSVSFEAGHVV